MKIRSGHGILIYSAGQELIYLPGDVFQQENVSCENEFSTENVKMNQPVYQHYLITVFVSCKQTFTESNN